MPWGDETTRPWPGMAGSAARRHTMGDAPGHAGAGPSDTPMRSSSIALILLALIIALPAAWGGGITRASVGADGTEGNGMSGISRVQVSADGRLVAFDSFADNLVPNDTNGHSDVFVRDLRAGHTTRVSVASDGGEANGFSEFPALSADGRFVTFVSRADNLAPDDTNGRADVFVHDRQTGETSRISSASDGTPANGASREPAISADGRFVAFASAASNLVPGDTNGRDDVFVHDRQARATERVSIPSGGGQGNGSSDSPALSADGRHVAFASLADNLAAGDTNGAQDVFVHDRATGETTCASVASDGTLADFGSFQPALSGDGRIVAFGSFASNLVAGNDASTGDIFVHDRQTGRTSCVSMAPDGGLPDADSGSPSLSADGRFVAFWSMASNLAAGDTNETLDIFRHDRKTGRTEGVSWADGASGNSASDMPFLSADGRFVAFGSTAIHLVPNDTNEQKDIFVWDAGAPPRPPLSRAADALRAAAGLTIPTPAEGAALDADGSGAVTLSDAAALAREAAGPMP